MQGLRQGPLEPSQQPGPAALAPPARGQVARALRHIEAGEVAQLGELMEEARATMWT